MSNVKHYQIAHMHIGDKDIVIIPIEDRFHHLKDSEQEAIWKQLSICSADADLRGDVALTWNYGGKMQFRAAHYWHSFLSKSNTQGIRDNLNKRLTCVEW